MATDTPSQIPPALLKQALLWIEVFRADWHGETPLKLHVAALGDDGTPDYAPEFARYLYSGEAGNGPRNPEDRLRTTRAFRRLRRRAPREFDVLYLIVAHRKSPSQVARQLTERAIRIDKPERYSTDDIIVLLLSGLDKVIKWW